MAKKINKKSRGKSAPRKERMSSSKLTILEGQQFVKVSSKRVARPSLRRGGERTIARAPRSKPMNKGISKIRATKTMKELCKTTPKKIVKKIAASKSKKITKASLSAQKKGGKGAKTSVSSKSKIVMGPAPIPPRSGSRLSNQSKKATQFKTSSRNDLQIPSFGFIDVCFCLDATGSMGGQIAQVKTVIESIIHNIENKVRTEGLQLRFAIVSYRDHPPQDSSYVTKINDFTDNYQTIAYVKTLQAGGGGDEPEAAHDGLYDAATKLRWAEVPGTPVLRYIFHIADAPPHGKQFLNPEPREGCLCGMQTDDVLNEINKKQIHYRLIKVRNNYKVDEMEKIFKKKLMDFDSTNISSANQMNVKVSDMIICEVLPDFA